MRKVIFTNKEYYHIYNRGVDKRVIFENKYDYVRFIESMFEFNIDKSIGSLYKKRLKNKNDSISNLQKNCEKLVEIIAYCLNHNHYHLLLKQVADGGISKFMHKIGTGYTNYFNEKKDRSGSLFQGSFKAV